MALWFRSVKRRVKVHGYHYLRCAAKTLTFLFWASLYVAVMRLTLFKSTENAPAVRDWSSGPDNYSKFLMQGEVLGDDDNTQIDPEWVENDNQTVAELEERITRVHQVCQTRALPSQTINNKEFFLDYKHHLVWCNIFKAASSSWLYNFNILGGYDKSFLQRSRHTPLMLARKKFPRPDKEDLVIALSDPSMTSLLIVREPFVRLLSAYRDKLEIRIPPYYKKLAAAIVAKHRKRAIKALGPIKRKGPTFYEFVAYLIDNHKSENKNATNLDEHWAPYYEFCSPCSVNFTVVAKVETLARDSAYVINVLGLGHILGTRVKNRRMRLRTVMNKSKDGKNTVELLRKYYSQLDEQMLEGLLKIYELDFEMFGYDPPFYRNLVKNKRAHTSPGNKLSLVLREAKTNSPNK